MTNYLITLGGWFLLGTSLLLPLILTIAKEDTVKVTIRNSNSTELPKDIFPGEEELRSAVQLDRLCNEINTKHDSEIEKLTASVLTRLDRLAYRPNATPVEEVKVD